MPTPDNSDEPQVTARANQRVVTMMFSDLKGSTALAERLDAETLRGVLSRYFDAMRAVVESHGGVIEKIIGDAIVSVFDGSTDAAGAARRASLAALESKWVLEALNDRFDATWAVRLQNRTGVASGLLAADDVGRDSDVLAGLVVGTAETLESNAPVGETLIEGATLELLGDAVTVESVGAVPRKGADGTVEAWLLIDLAVAEGDGGVDRTGATTRACPSCGTANDLDGRRCVSCGAVLATAGAGTERESRRTVTIVFADPKPRTADGEPMDPDTTRAVMTRYFEVMGPILVRHGGTVEKFIGDALMAVFGLPVRHEDDAVRAIRSAADMQAALPGLNEELAAAHGVTFLNPIGVNTGSVVAGNASAGQRFVTGDAVNVAARLEQTAAPGEIILGGLTHQLAGEATEVEVLEPLVLKGKSEPVPAFRLISVTRDTATGRRHDLPLVGRDIELGTMREVLQTSIAEGKAARLTLIGDAGVGKSRLTQEFLDEAAESALVLRGNCLAYGEGITFWPLLRLIQTAAGIDDDDDAATARERLAALIGDDAELFARIASIAGLVDTPYPVPELVWAMRRVLERGAAIRPLVAVLDDIHWAEPTLLDVIDELTRTLDGPVLFLCTARPTVHDDHHDFVAGAPEITLGPLTDADCERFLFLLLGDADVDPSAVTRIVDAAAGNPLFLEQLLSMLMDDGRLVQVDGGWRVQGDLAALEVPATVEAVLAARLDLLPEAERQAIEPASVIGRQFAVDAVAHLVEPEARPEIGEHLDGLAARDLVLPDAEDQQSYHFQHQLIRDATYNGLLKQARAILHEDFVDWAEARNEERDRSTEFDEILGYHLEQAYRCWQELGPLDDHAIELGINGSRRLTAAGERALARGDMHAASNLLTRAAVLLAEDHPARPRGLLLAGNSLHEIGAFDRALEAYEASSRASEASGDHAAAAAAHIEGLRLQYLIGRLEDTQLVEAEVNTALQRVGTTGDADALSRIWQLQLNLDIAACRWSAAQDAAEQVIAEAQRAGNELLAVRTMPLLAFLAQKGPMPVAGALAACEDILRQVADDRRSSSLAGLELAMLAAMDRDVERARRLCGETREALTELGWEMQAALVSLSSGPLELLSDEPQRAEAELRRDYEALQRLEEENFISLTAVLLAEAVYRQRRFEEAQQLVEFSERLAAPDDLAVQIILRSVAGKLAARSGDLSAGLDLAAEAVHLMGTTEDPSGLGDSLLDRAEVLFLAGEAEQARDAVRAAMTQYRLKGNVAGVDRAERVDARLAAGEDPLPVA